MTRRFALGSVVVVCALAAPSASALEPAKEAEGKKAFSAGVNLLNDPDGAKYDEALPLFRRAYDLLGNWKVLGNLGLSAMKLERDGEAIDAYERYLKDGGKGVEAAERTQVTRDLDTLKAQSARVHIEYPAGSRYLLDDRLASSGSKRTNRYELPGTSVDLRLRQGFHRIVVHTAKEEDLAWEIDLAAGASATHKFEVAAAAAPPPTASASVAPPVTTPPPVAPTKSGLGTGTWIAGGVTVALAAGAVVTGILAHGKHSDFTSVNGQPGHTRDEADSLRSSGQSLALVSTVLTGAAVLGAGVTAYLAISGKREETSASATWLGVGPTGVSLGSRFLSMKTSLLACSLVLAATAVVASGCLALESYDDARDPTPGAAGSTSVGGTSAGATSTGGTSTGGTAAGGKGGSGGVGGGAGPGGQGGATGGASGHGGGGNGGSPAGGASSGGAGQGGVSAGGAGHGGSVGGASAGGAPTGGAGHGGSTGGAPAGGMSSGGAGNGGTSAGGSSAGAGAGGGGAGGMDSCNGGAGGASPPTAMQGATCGTAYAFACAKGSTTIVLYCNPTTCAWDFANMCTSGLLCDDAAGADQGTCAPPPPYCAGMPAGTAVCDGVNRVVCGTDPFLPTSTVACSDAAHCTQSTGTDCAVCLDGEYQCSDVALQKCAADHKSFETVSTCASAALCNASAGACTAGACSAGQYSCNGSTLQTCKADFSGFMDVQACSGGTPICDAGNMTCDACYPDETVCASATATRTCATDGSAYGPATACPVGTPLCLNGSCVECETSADCTDGDNCLIPICSTLHKCTYKVIPKCMPN